MIDQTVALGALVGLGAALIQHLHLVRSIRSQTRKPSASPLGKPMTGFLVRLTVLVAIFVWAASWDRVRLDAAVIAFAAGHLVGMMVLGARISGGAFEKIERR